ncbi:hypothetical protein A3H90_01840 [Candidatus Peribacteria bacterium RIFCSPLOWO2_02_FULL_55_36]|nr:MAG: hypothetical protein A3H90_01840 [Candidatus Peribacteria bacterium RIFCSPLOWO2_02_FULL_55_36]
MYRFFESIIHPALAIIRPRVIVEIGIDKGFHTEKLLQYCKEANVVLHAIDPEPHCDIEQMQQTYGKHFAFYRDFSLNALYRIETYDMVLIDGDHNWYTVYHELLLIEKKAKEQQRFPVVFLHDIGWPYGRRDLYYHPENIPAMYRHPYQKKGIIFGKEGLTEAQGWNPDFSNAIYEHNLRNGVLTAVEDFIAQSRETFHFTKIPGFHSLGIITNAILFLQNSTFQHFLDSLHLSGPLTQHIDALEHVELKHITDARQQQNEKRQLETELTSVREGRDKLETELTSVREGRDRLAMELATKTVGIERITRTRSWRWTGVLRKAEAQWHMLVHRCVCDYPFLHFTRKWRLPGFPPHPVASTPPIFVSQPRPVDIIIPIHNAFEVTTRCIESVLAYTTDVPHRLLLIDDASTDTRMRPYLENIQHHHPSRVRIFFLPENRGFVQTVNYALPLTASHDVVLLNSDTEVSPYWLSGLAKICGEKEDTATVTPLSNKASIYSIMEPAWADVMLRKLDVAEIGTTVRNHSLRLYPEIPTAVGFCMYMKREAIDRVGFFDEEFGHGYGEENDWCMRARAAGFRHYLDDATFVYHKGHVSMRAAGHLLPQEEHRKDHELILQRKHPSYRATVHSFLKNDQHLPRIRQHLHHFLLEKVSADRRRLALLVHRPIDGSCIGGTEFNVRDLVEELQSHIDCFVVFPKDNAFVVKRLVDTCTVSYTFPLPSPLDREAALAKTFGSILDTFCIELFHVHHALDTSFRLIGVAKERGLRVLYTVHDFYALSPNYHLVREDGTYHGIPDDGETYGSSNEETHGNWRKHVRHYLEQVDVITAPSSSSLTLFDSVYGDLPATRHVIEHGDPFAPSSARHFPSKHRVCFLGAVHEIHKGRNIIVSAAEYIAQQGIDVVFLGCHSDFFAQALSRCKNISFLGFYARDDVQTILQNQQISLVCILSILQETFSHTLSESWLARIPVYVTNVGALAERVRETHAGKIAPSFDPISIAKDIVDFLHSPDYRKVWQRTQELKLKTSAEMAEKYLPLYEHLWPKKDERHDARGSYTLQEPASMLARTKEQWLTILQNITKGYMTIGGHASFYETGHMIMNHIRKLGAWKEGDAIVDVGCGNGRCAIPLTQFSINYVGLDVIPESIHFCRSAFAQWPNFRFIHLRSNNALYNPDETMPPTHVCFPIASESADFVIAISLFTHFETAEAVAAYLHEMQRILKRKGKFWCTWFRAPPNDPCASAHRTVFPEHTIMELIRPFTILHTEWGLTTGHHDQWQMLLQKQ